MKSISKMKPEQLQVYFSRIGFSKKAEADLATLAALQELHVQHFPFEDLNPLLHLPVKLDPESLFQKLVSHHRGGYCFEQNGLFKIVLQMIGFEVTSLLGRVVQPGAPLSRKTHECLHVRVENKIYHVDVGFGGLVPPTPLLFESGLEQETPLEKYRIMEEENHDFSLQILKDKEWKTLYLFDLRPQRTEDLEVPNWYTSTHPESKFTRQLMLCIVGNSCRYALSRNVLSRHFVDKPSERKALNSKEEIREVLEKIFRLNLQDLPELDEKLQQIIDENQEE